MAAGSEFKISERQHLHCLVCGNLTYTHESYHVFYADADAGTAYYNGITVHKSCIDLSSAVWEARANYNPTNDNPTTTKED